MIIQKQSITRGDSPQSITFTRAEEDLLALIQNKWGKMDKVDEVKELMRGLKGIIAQRRPWVMDLDGIETDMDLFKYSYQLGWPSRIQTNTSLISLYPFLTSCRVYWEKAEDDLYNADIPLALKSPDTTTWGRLNDHL